LSSQIYLDTSAFLHAFLDQAPEKHSMQLLVDGQMASAPLISSELLWLEADRAVVRLTKQDPTAFDLPIEVTSALLRMQMIDLDRQIINAARAIPEVVKSLDALHIASAELVADALKFVVTCDHAMAHVLNQRGIVEAVTPSEALVRL